MNRINDKLNEVIVWMGDKRNTIMFYTEAYSKDVCHLELSDYENRATWTFYWENESVDLKDIPKNWTVIYNSCVTGFKIPDDKEDQN